MSQIGKLLIFVGLIVLVTGVVFYHLGKIPGMGRLPGDFYVRKGNMTFYFPLVTCLLISFILLFALSLFGKR